MSGLKALGAYRLLEHFKAEEALEYTKHFIKGGLYAKIPDWYEAKARALGILRTEFRHRCKPCWPEGVKPWPGRGR